MENHQVEQLRSEAASAEESRRRGPGRRVVIPARVLRRYVVTLVTSTDDGPIESSIVARDLPINDALVAARAAAGHAPAARPKLVRRGAGAAETLHYAGPAGTAYIS